MTNINEMEISKEMLEQAAGGTVNKNPTPTNTTGIADQVINGKNYDALAQLIADWLNGDDVRTRAIDNTQDINDYMI